MSRKLSKKLWQVNPALLGAALIVAASGRVSAAPVTTQTAEVVTEIPQKATTQESQSIEANTAIAQKATKPEIQPIVDITPPAAVSTEIQTEIQTEKPVSVTPTNPVGNNTSVSPNQVLLQQIERYNNQRVQVEDENLQQVTSVSQLADVKPTDWAYEAIRGLVERYSCTAGYPDGRFRGNRSLSRYEFAAGLNACLQRIQELAADRPTDLVLKQDLAAIQQLIAQFGPELAILRAKVDALQARTTELDLTQFSTTTKLRGEVIFGLTGIVAGDNIFGEKVDNVTI